MFILNSVWRWIFSSKHGSRGIGSLTRGISVINSATDAEGRIVLIHEVIAAIEHERKRKIERIFANYAPAARVITKQSIKSARIDVKVVLVVLVWWPLRCPSMHELR